MANDSNLNIQVTAGGVEETVQKLNTVNDKVTELAAKSESIQALGSSFAKLSVAIAAFATGAIYAAIKTDELRQALDNVGGKGAEQFAKFSTEANKLGLGIEAIAKSAIKLEATGLTNETTRKLIDSVGEAVRKMGGGDAQFTTVINGLEMIASTGVLTNRSLRTIEKTAPELKGAIEQAFGTDNTKKIIAMNLTVEEFMKRIADAAAKMSPHVRTIGDAFNELKNNVLTTMGSLGDTLVKDLKIAEFFDKMGNAIRTVIKAFQDLDPNFRKAIEVALLLIAAIGPIVVIFGAIVAVMNPVGLAMIGLSILIGEIVGHWNRLRDSLGYVVSAVYGLKAGFEMLMVPLLAIGGMILRLVAFIGDGVEGFKAAGKVVDSLTTSLYNNITAASKHADTLRDQTTATIKLREESERLAEVERKATEAKTTAAANAKGNGTIITGVGGATGGKDPKVQRDEQADVDSLFSLLERKQKLNDQFNLEIRQHNMLALGISLEDIKAYSDNYLKTIHVAKNNELQLSNNTGAEMLAWNKKYEEEKDAAAKKGFAQIAAAAKQTNDYINAQLQSMASALGGGLAQVFQSGNWNDLGKTMLSAVGGIMVSLGNMCIAAGLSVEWVKQALKNPLGMGAIGAIAAGIALVAIGSMFSAATSSMGSGGGGGSYATPSSSGAMSSGQGADGNLAALQKMSSNSNIMGKVTIKGSDLVLAMQRNNINTRQ